MVCGILVTQPGMEPVPPALEAQRLNHWTAREVQVFIFCALFLELNDGPHLRRESPKGEKTAMGFFFPPLKFAFKKKEKTKNTM